MTQKPYISALTHTEGRARALFNPIKSLTPASLSRILDAFHAGRLAQAAWLWEVLERRDDVLQGVVSKRKKSVARLRWEILTTHATPEAKAHQAALLAFYNTLECTHACDASERGSLALLIKQMMDAVGKQYAVHEIVWKPSTHYGHQHLQATFHFVPLWFFEKRQGRLHFHPPGHDQARPLEPGQWMVTKGEGLMESCSIAYLFKHLPLRDWLVYCERNGMPGVKGVTDAQPGSPQWEAALDAVRDFGAEFHALMSRGTTLEAVDLSARGELPYPRLVDRMDRAMIALWRGSDLSTLGQAHGTGVQAQQHEMALLEQDDAMLVSETLNAQVDRYVIQHLFGPDVQPQAYFKLLPRDLQDKRQELAICQGLLAMGFPLQTSDVAERFGFSLPAGHHPYPLHLSASSAALPSPAYES
jgi:phage gp29-like protein